MRHIKLMVTDDDRAAITKRDEGKEETKGGLFGQAELLLRLLEVSPKCTKLSDITQLLRINRKIDEIKNQESPVLELEEGEWTWVKTILDHDKYQTYGAPLLHRIGELLENIEETKSHQKMSEEVKK